MSSRTGKLPIIVPQNVDLKYDQDSCKVTVKGPLGEINSYFLKEVNIDRDGDKVYVRINENFLNVGKTDALKGLYHKLLSNFVTGVSSGFEKKLEVIGVGYKASLINKDSRRFLDLNLGFSHEIYFLLPEEVTCNIEENKGKNILIKLKSFDKYLLCEVASIIRRLRPPECYKGKGIRYCDEYVPIKVGKRTSSLKTKK